jgi:hypothetical protein
MRVDRILHYSAAALALSIMVHATKAQAVELEAGQTLSVTFTESGPESVLGGAITGAGGLDVDTLGFFETDNLSGPASGVAQLYNGTTLLGTVNFIADQAQLFAFVAPGSQFTAAQTGTLTNWSSIIAGTINGVLDITLNESTDISISLFGLGVGFSGNEVLGASPGLTITGESVLTTTPLPAALPLFAGVLGLMGFVARRRKRKATAVAAA